MEGMLGRRPATAGSLGTTDAIVLATSAALSGNADLADPTLAPSGGFRIRSVLRGRQRIVLISGADDRGVLYGVFALLRRIALRTSRSRRSTSGRHRRRRCAGSTSGTISMARSSAATAADRSSSRTTPSPPTSRACSDYARLLASVGINGCAINNVNADPRVLTPRVRAAAGRASPRRSGRGACGWSLSSTSAARRRSAASTPSIRSIRRVVAFWKATRRRNLRRHSRPWRLRPQGRLRRAGSGRRRTAARHADAANVIARALAPARRLLFYRGFVYDHHMDWRNLKNDRARAAVRQLPAARRPVRRQRHPADQARADRLPGARARLAAVRRAARRPTRRSSCRSRRSTSASSGTSCSWCRCGRSALDFDLRARRCRHAGEGRWWSAARSSSGRRRIRRRRRTSDATTTGWGTISRMANLYGFGRLAWNPDLTAAADRRRVDAADVRQRSAAWSPRSSSASCSTRGRPTRATPAARRRHADRHHRRPLRPGRRVVRAQRLGTVASRR